jgi:hypothetical protein
MTQVFVLKDAVIAYGLLAVLLIASPSSNAQTQTSTRPTKFVGVNFSGSLRVRPEVWDWYETTAAESQYTYLASLLRLSFSQERAKWDWQAEFAQPLLLGLPEHSIAPAPQGQLGLGANYFAANGDSTAGYFFAKQAFVRFKGLFGDKSSNLRAGRFEFVDGTETAPKDSTLAALKRERIAHRLIGNFAFSHVGRSFDGVHFTRGNSGTNVTLVAARATQGVFQVNGWGELDTDILYCAVTRAVARKSPGELRAFALSYHDGRRALKTDNRPGTARAADQHNIRVTTLGGNYLQTAITGSGTADLLLWGAAQFGNWGLLQQRAGAVAMEGGFQPICDSSHGFARVIYSALGTAIRMTGSMGPFSRYCQPRASMRASPFTT